MSAVVWGGTQRGWFLQVNQLARATPALHAPVRLFAEYGVALFAVVLLVTWWRSRGDQDSSTVAAALWAPVGALLAIGLNQPLVTHVHEARPYTVLPETLLLVSPSQDYAFPSDHAVMAGAVTAGVLLANRRLGAVTAIAALIMAFARVYVGAHFPLDVMVGLLFGAVVTLLGYLAARPLLISLITGLARTPLRPLLTNSPPSVVR
jgi:membrane-associated phospholipid phosphatase